MRHTQVQGSQQDIVGNALLLYDRDNVLYLYKS